jgi:hypothetical protein
MKERDRLAAQAELYERALKRISGLIDSVNYEAKNYCLVLGGIRGVLQASGIRQEEGGLGER